ncbi:follistatin-related protein 1-like isoform X2 [Centruroides vittatus]|uniref:follistatin-related protein 1-like isoform X2 n=1 Tax=Centruroides vittatus TaxID=120091 RepID=UPI00350FC0A3
MMKHILILSLVSCWILQVKGERKHESACDFIKCRAGRECKVLKSGVSVCSCIDVCPDHYAPVCGSNGISYENHCLLHRDACLRQTHISIKSKGYCKNGFPVKKKHSRKIKRPVVCFQKDRDHMLQVIVERLKEQQKKDERVRSKSYQTIVKEKFNTCNADNDDYLDSSEFLECIKENETLIQNIFEESVDLISALCVDAIIEAADQDSDWLLSFEEFRTSMDPLFKPKKKLCSLEGKKYEDGAETSVDCNNCVCACGNWVCTSSTCLGDFGKENRVKDPKLSRTLSIKKQI